ncbi:MAG: hypothetical protein QOK07_1340, partial [Gemmatimonadaceae bacterium]|nr:hypothetical protein [Gemmatimonadaceae bacterium]
MPTPAGSRAYRRAPYEPIQYLATVIRQRTTAGLAARFATALILLVVAAVTALAWFATQRLGGDVRAADQVSKLASGYESVAGSADLLSQAYLRDLADYRPLTPAVVTTAVNQLSQELQGLSRLPGADKDAVFGIAARVSQFGIVSQQVIRLYRSNQREAGTRLERDVAGPIIERFTAQLDALADAAHNEDRAKMAEVRTVSARLGRNSPIILGSTFVLALLLLVTARRHHRRIEALATTDALTGLPNRLALAEQAAHVLAGQSPDSEDESAALLILDLDRFKEINDGLGHFYGDQLLVQIANRLRTSVKSTDLVVRLGGDEFAVLLGTGGIRLAQRVADRIHHTIRQPFSLNDVTVQVDVSIGIASVGQSPTEPPSLSTLMRRADLAMYAAKEAGIGSSVYADGEDERVSHRIRTIAELRRAVDHDELILHYQPKVAMDDGRLLGAEALVRWQHPRRGLLTPASFLPMVENTELMDRITA